MYNGTGVELQGLAVAPAVVDLANTKIAVCAVAYHFRCLDNLNPQLQGIRARNTTFSGSFVVRPYFRL